MAAARLGYLVGPTWLVAELEKVSFNFDGDAAAEKAAREKLQSQGVTIHPVMPSADRAALRKSALETWDVLAKETGGDAAAFYAAMEAGRKACVK